MMDNARPSAAGTDFTLQYCVYTLVGLVAGGAGLALAGAFGYPAVIIGSSLAAFIATLLVALLYTPAPAGTDSPPAETSPISMAVAE
jgi:hypothetical protein